LTLELLLLQLLLSCRPEMCARREEARASKDPWSPAAELQEA
jgi:hypothetical protein